MKTTRLEINDNVYFVKKPSPKDSSDAQLYSSKIFNEARKNGAILKIKLQEYLMEQGIWTQEKQTKLLDIVTKMVEIEENLAKGKNGKFKTKSEAKKAALELRVLRYEQNSLLMETRDLESYTVEGQAENAKFDYLCSICILDVNQNRIFKSIDEYYENADEEYVKKCAEELSYLLYPDVDREWQKKLPENKFLIENKFVNDNLELVDENGNRIDINGEKITSVEPDYAPFDD